MLNTNQALERFKAEFKAFIDATGEDLTPSEYLAKIIVNLEGGEDELAVCWAISFSESLASMALRVRDARLQANIMQIGTDMMEVCALMQQMIALKVPVKTAPNLINIFREAQKVAAQRGM